MEKNIKTKCVSVIIPMYNNEDTIIRALNSVKKQTALNLILEIIVINDGSIDNSLEIVKEYTKSNKDLPIRLVDKKNGGVSSARNAGMRLVKSEYIALLDADDEWLSDKLEIQINLMIERPEIDFLGGNYNGKDLFILFKKVNELHKASVKQLCIKFFPVTPSAVFKSKIVDDIGYFDENQKYGEDGNYFIKICSRYNYYHLPVQMVICGSGKPEFGYSGLSSNLKGMYEGNIKNIKELKEQGTISFVFYAFLRCFYWLKYIRRIIIVEMG